MLVLGPCALLCLNHVVIIAGQIYCCVGALKIAGLLHRVDADLLGKLVIVFLDTI